MDPVKNPYTPNAGSQPPELAGRDPQLDQFRVMIERLKIGRTDQSLIATGLRGVGKTVLLNAFENQAEASGFIPFFHELTPTSELIDSLARDAARALETLSLSDRIAARVRSGLSHLKTIKLTGPGGFGLAVDLGSASEGAITEDLTDLFLEVGKAAKEREAGVIFFLDELQFIEPAHYRALISALHRANQKALPICAAAAGLPQIPRLTGESRSYAERLFTFPQIANLSDEDAAIALVEPARKEGVEFEEAAVQRALEWTAGYPFYIQQLGKHVWNLSGQSPITLQDVETAIPPAQEALDSSIYEVRIQRATDNERKYMRAMAELGDGPYKSGAVARKFGKTSTAASPVRQQLIDKGLIYATEDYGHLDFTVPRFAEYMRRHMPFTPPPRRRRPATGKKGSGRKQP